MEKQLKIVYYYNSGFSVQVGSTLFIFDYWEGENRSLSASVRIRPELLKAYERIYVFISHAHPDHLDPVVGSSNTSSPQICLCSTLPGRKSLCWSLYDDSAQHCQSKRWYHLASCLCMHPRPTLSSVLPKLHRVFVYKTVVWSSSGSRTCIAQCWRSCGYESWASTSRLENDTGSASHDV